MHGNGANTEAQSNNCINPYPYPWWGGAFDGKACLILFVSEVDVFRFPDVVVELISLSLSASGCVGRLGEVLADVSS